MKVLPPKRFADPYDPYYDPIRHEKWYAKLLTRRAQNAHLGFAYLELASGDTQKAISALYGVDPRELRDYANWVNKTPRKAISAQEQAILDGAYEMYSGGMHDRKPFGACIRRVASLFGVKGRPIEEMWEIRHDFWPQGYKRSGE